MDLNEIENESDVLYDAICDASHNTSVQIGRKKFFIYC